MLTNVGGSSLEVKGSELPQPGTERDGEGASGSPGVGRAGEALLAQCMLCARR